MIFLMKKFILKGKFKLSLSTPLISFPFSNLEDWFLKLSSKVPMQEEKGY